MCLSMSLAAVSTHRLILVFSLDGIFFSGCLPSFVQLGGFCLLNLRCCDFFCGHVGGGGGYFSFFWGSLCLFRNSSILSLNVCNSVVCQAMDCVARGPMPLKASSTVTQTWSNTNVALVKSHFCHQFLPFSGSAIRPTLSCKRRRPRILLLIVCRKKDAAASKVSNDTPQTCSSSAEKDYFSESSETNGTNGSSFSVSERKKVQPAAPEQQQPIQLDLRSLNLVKTAVKITAWVDALTEKGMHKRRTFYSHDDWLQHRSSTRHARHFLSSLSSRVILSLIPPVGTITLIASVIAAYNSVILAGWLPSYIPLLHASALPYQLTAPALALLLVFRTEASYSRYDEARKTWTKVISSTKDLARQSLTWIQQPEDSDQKEALLRYIVAFPLALKVNPTHL